MTIKRPGEIEGERVKAEMTTARRFAGSSRSLGCSTADIGDVVNEFVERLPEQLGDEPILSDPRRSELEWKHLCFAMAAEIIRLRQ